MSFLKNGPLSFYEVSEKSFDIVPQEKLLTVDNFLKGNSFMLLEKCVPVFPDKVQVVENQMIKSSIIDFYIP